MVQRFLAPFYADPFATNRTSYGTDYGDHERDRIGLDIRPQVLIGPFTLESPATSCHARLYEVREWFGRGQLALTYGGIIDRITV